MSQKMKESRIPIGKNLEGRGNAEEQERSDDSLRSCYHGCASPAFRRLAEIGRSQMTIFSITLLGAWCGSISSCRFILEATFLCKDFFYLFFFAFLFNFFLWYCLVRKLSSIRVVTTWSKNLHIINKPHWSHHTIHGEPSLWSCLLSEDKRWKITSQRKNVRGTFCIFFSLGLWPFMILRNFHCAQSCGRQTFIIFLM